MQASKVAPPQVSSDQKPTWSSFAVQTGGETAQFNRGVGAEVAEQFLDIVRSGKPFYSLEAEFVYAPLFAARKMGVDDEYIQGWQSGFLGNPKREEQRLTEAYEAGYTDGEEKSLDNLDQWVKS